VFATDKTLDVLPPVNVSVPDLVNVMLLPAKEQRAAILNGGVSVEI
jgi:hypothetical protein